MLCVAPVRLATLNLPDRNAQSNPRLTLSFSVISATSTSISTWRGMRSSCLIVLSISGQFRGNVVTMMALVVSSAMKRTCPSTRPASPMRPVPVVGAPPTGPPAKVDGGGAGAAGDPGGRGVLGGVGVVVGVVSRPP